MTNWLGRKSKPSQPTLPAEKEAEEKEGVGPGSDHQVSALGQKPKFTAPRWGRGDKNPARKLGLGLRVRLSLDPDMTFRIGLGFSTPRAGTIYIAFVQLSDRSVKMLVSCS